MSFRIDRVTETDEQAWRDLWSGYLAFYESQRPDVLYRRNFAQLVGGSGPLFGWIARDAEGAPIGFTHYLFHATAWSLTETCYLQDLFVLPQQRGGGIAAALIEAVAASAKARLCERLYWMTHVDNARARLLYERVARNEGFICYERNLGENPGG